MTKQKLPSQLIPVARHTLDEATGDIKYEQDEDKNVMTIITIADFLANTPFEEVSVILTEDHE